MTHKIQPNTKLKTLILTKTLGVLSKYTIYILQQVVKPTTLQINPWFDLHTHSAYARHRLKNL